MDAAETVNHQKKILFLSLAAAALATGCQSPDVYYWGHYENLIYASYAKPGKTPPESQILVMQADEQKAISANKPLSLGFHAHLGYLYYEAGKSDLAVQEFQKEKAEFPESTVFMDRLIANLTKK